MKHLEHLHHQLARLRSVRQQVRWATAAAAAAIAVLAALAVIFALDWAFQRNEDLWQRLFLLVLGTGAVVWAVRRFALPWLGQQEDQLEMALLVQRQAGIDSDLVAAMQFESKEAERWGSVQLETAVVEGVSSRQASLNVMAAVPYRPLLKRLRILLLPLLFWAIVSVAFPAYVRVFFHRLLLGSQHYPTQTQIVALTVNDKNIDLSATDSAAVRVPYGQPVRFEVKASGPHSVAGRVELTAAGHAQSAVVPLEASSDNVEGDDSGVFQGTHARLIQPARYQVWLGDAFTDPLKLEVVPLPIVEVEPEVLPPAYARGHEAALQKLAAGTRQFAVIEGSEVRIKIRSDHPLKSVTLKVGDKPVALQKQEAEASAEGEVWMSETAGTPLAAVTEPLRYTIQATDTEDASLEQPLEGVIRIEPDLPPRVVAKTVAPSPCVLPVGAPTIYYGATDDHAIGRIWLTWEVVHGEGSEASKEEIEIYRLAPNAEPEATRTGAYEFDLSPLHLAVGDSLKVTLHASDYRGPRPGKATSAEPIVFQVTDEQGLITSLGEDQKKTAQKFDEIIKHELGLGGSP